MDKNFCPKLKYPNEILQKNCNFHFQTTMQQFPILQFRMPYLRFFSLDQPGPEILDIFMDIFGQKYKKRIDNCGY